MGVTSRTRHSGLISLVAGLSTGIAGLAFIPLVGGGYAVAQVVAGANRYEGKSCLSAGCHADMTKFKSVHSPIEQEDCAACHEEGEDKANHKFRITDTPPALCFECHDEEDFEDPQDAGSRHGPVTQGQCLDCHDPHASAHGHVLVESYADDYYVPVEHSDRYQLCFECHDSELMEEPQTDEDTQFRNGETNLHYLHVNREIKGRSCRMCHLPHASAQRRLIRSVVEFGEWKLKIVFVPTETGGACGPGCHPAKQYDRETPVDWNKDPTLGKRPLRGGS